MTKPTNKIVRAMAANITAQDEYERCCENVAEALRKKRLAEARLAKTKVEEAKAEEDAGTVTCSLCHAETPETTAHLHQGEWIGDECCWDERLKASE